VAEAEAGVCIPSGDAAAMAEGLRRLRSDPALRERLGKNGLEAVTKKYSRRANAEAALLSLRAAIEAHRGAA
jgi:glycosyltransferase involved in cell wall biosynthesis